MSGRRFSPWPAYVDLFSGLVVLMFAVIVIDVVRAKQSPVQKMADDVLASIKKDVGDVVQQCSDQDLCVNLSLNFDTGKDDIKTGNDMAEIRGIAEVLLKTLEEQEKNNPKLKGLVRIVVEGHTDSRVPPNLTDRARFTYNWNLSARRASSVMYALDAYGLGVRNKYNIVSVGKASSEPFLVCEDGHCQPCVSQRDRCEVDDAECRRRADSRGPDPCDDKNRRTTIRIDFDYKAAGMNEETTASRPPG